VGGRAEVRAELKLDATGIRRVVEHMRAKTITLTTVGALYSEALLRINLPFKHQLLQPENRKILQGHGTMDYINDAQTLDEMLRFSLNQTSTSECVARLGQLTLRARVPVSTPHYIVPTSRGAIPHLSQDNIQKHTKISAVYVPLEDCGSLWISALSWIADL
jgi:hypothetical protein